MAVIRSIGFLRPFMIVPWKKRNQDTCIGCNHNLSPRLSHLYALRDFDAFADCYSIISKYLISS